MNFILIILLVIVSTSIITFMILYIVYKYQGIIFLYYIPRRRFNFQVVHPYVSHYIKTEDEVEILFYTINNQSGTTLIYFHGNGSDIISDSKFVEDITQNLNYNIITIDYRGYGKSKGLPYQEVIINDSRKFIQTIIKRRIFEETNFFILGNSLGGAVALHIIGEFYSTIKGLIIQNTFTSIEDMLKLKIGKGSPRFVSNVLQKLVKEKWDNVEALNSLKRSEIQQKLPILFLESTNDKIIPQGMMKKLYDSYAGKKFFVKLIAGHNTIFRNEKYFETIKVFVKKCC